MALVEHCFCCSVQIASGFFAAYLLIAYLIAFAFELIWILESETSLPPAAVLLCAGYFAMALFAALLIHGLATKNPVCLVAWMFAVTVLTFPEAGMVIYMSVQYWHIESLYGVTELACWFIRIIINVIEIILIQSLYTMWKDEESVDKRLRDLNMAAVASVQRENYDAPLNSQYYQNNGYEQSLENFDADLRRYGSVPHLWNNMIQVPMEGYQFCTTQSEFNASIFVPNFVHSDMAPSLIGKKAQSLIDLRFLEDAARFPQRPYLTQSLVTETTSAVVPRLDSPDAKSQRLTKCASMDALTDGAAPIIRNRTGFYAQPVESYGVPIYYGPLDGPDFLIYKKQIDKLTSRNSLSNASADDVQKYRDVAL